MRPQRIAVAALLLTLFALPATAAAHSREGGFQRMTDLPRDWHTPYAKRGGVPVTPYPHQPTPREPIHSPVTISTYGLAHWSLWWRYRDGEHLTKARRAANWLVREQRTTGKWTYDAYWPVSGADFTLSPGWSSAEAQGEAIALLSRVYRHTGDRKYLTALRKAMWPLRKHVNDGGLARWWHGNLYLETYPTPGPNFVLNGYILALFGLHDAADLDPHAASLFRRGVRTLARTIHTFDQGHYARYSWSAPHTCPLGCEPLLQGMLEDLTKMTGRPIFAKYAKQWTGYPEFWTG